MLRVISSYTRGVTQSSESWRRPHVVTEKLENILLYMHGAPKIAQESLQIWIGLPFAKYNCYQQDHDNDDSDSDVDESYGRKD